ncbi:MAG: 2-oxoglutarate and iron-dependent oxygenase domain-containing protein [Ilumatobacter fluminis]|uniref:isopenicillin N synthase family dioxygenase n=1 Tax=Ilumatobacter fluminis TaxID=467091 RepID=UPI0032EACBB3
MDLVDLRAVVADPELHGDAAIATARSLDRACRELGFFRLTGHGIDPALIDRLAIEAQAFFDQPDEVKAEVAMSTAGAAWRGWFPVKGEITSGRPDRKEGLYVGEEHPSDHPRVEAGTPLHGANRFPPGPLGPTVLEYLDAIRPVADLVMRTIAVALGLPARWFEDNLTAEPTQLFRIFHYPDLPDNETSDEYGVGTHTDYGLLTLLLQDDQGGLEVQRPDGTWFDVPAEPGVLVCNIGDMLDRLTEGRYRSTPHRVRNTSGRSRLSFPYFFDPSWDAEVVPLPLEGSPPADDGERRWDGASVHAWSGTYGEYLTAKVARVFPELFASVRAGRGSGDPGSGDLR